MTNTLHKGDKVSVTVNGKIFYKAEFIETIENTTTGQRTHKVKVFLPNDEFVDYFIELHPIEKSYKNLKETNHDYQNCLTGNYYDSKMTGMFSSWNDFKEQWLGFTSNDPDFEKYDDTYHFIFRYDIHLQKDNLYELELCIMLQRKGIYTHSYVQNITYEELNGEVAKWLKGRLKYLKTLWKEIDSLNQ